MAYKRKTNRAYRKITMTELGEAPCDVCQHAPRCGAERLACSVFEDWVDTGIISDGERHPDRKTYQSVYYADSAVDWEESRKITAVEDGPNRVQLTAPSGEDAA